MATGHVVAVKQIKINHLQVNRENDLRDILMEIDLLKRLHHPNIVAYGGFLRSGDSFNIIMEYCENGSLLTIMKRYGKFSDQLAGVYIAQVLEGLKYLHDQGVIHRDIKAANILTTKSGVVKLADFGVASKLSEASAKNVAGSPYWMAPEIIELNGAGPSSDIWSLGCTVIELLKGHPPYHKLAPMSALFHIVQDEHPPFPVGVSNFVSDFLGLCLHKDANFRPSAATLSNHPWIRKAKETSRGGEIESCRATESITTTPIRHHVKKIDREDADSIVWDADFEIQEEPQSVLFVHNQHQPHRHRSALSTPVQSTPTPPSNMKKNARKALFSLLGVRSGSVGDVTWGGLAKRETLRRGMDRGSGRVDEEPERWDSDFEHIPSRKFMNTDTFVVTTTGAITVNSTVEQLESWDSDFDFVTNNDRNSSCSSSRNNKKNNSKNNSSNDENKSIKNNNSYNRNKSFVAVSAARTPAPPPTPAPLAAAGAFLSPLHSQSRVYLGAISDDGGGVGGEVGGGLAKDRRDSLSIKSSQSTIVACPEADDGDDYTRDFYGDEITVLEKIKLAVELDESEDPFDNMLDDSKTEVVDENFQLSEESIIKLVDELILPNNTNINLAETSSSLIDALKKRPDLKRSFRKYHRLLPILDFLESATSSSQDVISLVLAVLNEALHQSTDIQEVFCLIGGVPIVLSYGGHIHSKSLRLQVLSFIHKMSSTKSSIQALISCRGLTALFGYFDMLNSKDPQSQGVLKCIIDILSSMLIFQDRSSKNDFCRLLAKLGFIPSLANILPLLQQCEFEQRQLGAIFLDFSQSDFFVQEKVALSFEIIASQLELLAPSSLSLFLKCAKNLSMQSKLVSILGSTGLIEIIVNLLPKNSTTKDMRSSIFQSLFNLCRLCKTRLERAICAGLTPHLLDIIDSSSPLRNFAIPVFCEAVSCSVACRKILWEKDAMRGFIHLLSDTNWHVNALGSISIWMSQESTMVELSLLKHQSALTSSLQFSAANIEPFLGALHRLISTATGILRGVLGSNAGFVAQLVHLLKNDKVGVRLSSLKILAFLLIGGAQQQQQPYQNGCSGGELSLLPTAATDENDQYGEGSSVNVDLVLRQLETTDSSVLVRELASRILKSLGPYKNRIAPTMTTPNSFSTGA